MEQDTQLPIPSNHQNVDVFFDALDDFPPSSADDDDQPDQSTSSSTLDVPDSKPSPTSHLRLRASRRELSGDDSKTSTLQSSQTDPINDARLNYRCRKFRLRRNLKPPESIQDPVEPVPAPSDQKDEGSTVTTAADDDRGGDSADSAMQLGDTSFNPLVFVAGLIIKAIGLQINLIISIVTFPAWILYNSYMLLVDPLQIVGRGREFLRAKLVNLSALAAGAVSPLVGEWVKDKDSVWKVALRFGWGLVWAFYVGFLLCGLLVSSLVFSGVFMRYIVVEPLQMKEMLNFDYTKHSPVAYVPVVLCAGVGCGVDCKEKVRDGGIFGYRVIPPGHKLAASVKFVLPESEYNRNLGIFQVRVQFLSAEGKTLASLSHPCMLYFKSEPIRLLLTFIKMAPLISGYISESQTLNLKFRGFVEGDSPTACLKVTIEQRAEYNPGAGIPEIYDASMTLESELPLFKRIIWNWRRTLFVWMSMMMFMMEMLFTLVCCRPLVIPRARPRAASASTSPTQTQSSPPVRN
ncbi:putative Seipin family protein [Rosa chinensis]|uniref:Putative Seipin family protein n=1 Tax=Rosa chinensis TaxID=74649 RepID=A0A2P6Q506_ROSCH|nr:seipin-2 [Rosa chinensis]PRQ29267.1 putative Seipin family protein [Rosa chinensis]